MNWEVYMLMADNGALYTGIARDAEKRFYQHLEDKTKGAKFFRGNPPVTILYREFAKDRSEASIREAQIKKLKRTEKEALIEGFFLDQANLMS
jgi:putative endonuclease